MIVILKMQGTIVNNHPQTSSFESRSEEQSGYWGAGSGEERRADENVVGVRASQKHHQRALVRLKWTVLPNVNQPNRC